MKSVREISVGATDNKACDCEIYIIHLGLWHGPPGLFHKSASMESLSEKGLGVSVGCQETKGTQINHLAVLCK